MIKIIERLLPGSVALLVLLARCQDVMPLQADLKELHDQVSRMQIEVSALKASADNAAAKADAARRDAEQA
jgi:hypothetical protein